MAARSAARLARGFYTSAPAQSSRNSVQLPVGLGSQPHVTAARFGAVRRLAEQAANPNNKEEEKKPEGGFFSSLSKMFGSSKASAETATAEKPKAAAQEAPKDEANASATSGPYSKLLELGTLLKKEIFDPLEKESSPYSAPSTRKRSVLEKKPASETIKENTEQTGLVMHSESKFQQQWSEFKDNNPVIKALFDLRMKYDESDNIFVRAARSVTDTLTEKFGTVFEEGEAAQVLHEINKVDRTFRLDQFAKHLEETVAPVMTEAFLAGDEATLKEWCSEMCFSVLSEHIRQRKAAGLKIESKILELRNCDLVQARMMEQGPVLIYTFSTQQVVCVRDATGAIREGGEDNVQRVLYILAMRRDPGNFDPLGAWQVMEFTMAGSVETW